MLKKIAKQCVNTTGFQHGMSAAEFRKANPAGAMRIAKMIKKNMPQLVAEISDALSK